MPRSKQYLKTAGHISLTKQQKNIMEQVIEAHLKGKKACFEIDTHINKKTLTSIIKKRLVIVEYYSKKNVAVGLSEFGMAIFEKYQYKRKIQPPIQRKIEKLEKSEKTNEQLTLMIPTRKEIINLQPIHRNILLAFLKKENQILRFKCGKARNKKPIRRKHLAFLEMKSLIKIESYGDVLYDVLLTTDGKKFLRKYKKELNENLQVQSDLIFEKTVDILEIN